MIAWDKNIILCCVYHSWTHISWVPKKCLIPGPNAPAPLSPIFWKQERRKLKRYSQFSISKQEHWKSLHLSFSLSLMRAGLHSRNAEVKAVFKEFHQSYSCWQKKLGTPAKRNTWAGHPAPSRSGAQGGLGSTALAGPSHWDQPTLTPVHGLSNVQKAHYREVIHQNLPTGSFLQEKQFLPAFLSVTLSQQLRGWNQGIAGGFHSGPRASTHQSSSFVNCS